MKFLMEGHVDSIYTPHPTASFSQCTILRHKQKKAHPISLLHSSMPPQKSKQRHGILHPSQQTRQTKQTHTSQNKSKSIHQATHQHSNRPNNTSHASKPSTQQRSRSSRRTRPISPILQRPINNDGARAIDGSDIRRAVLQLLIHDILLIDIIASAGIVLRAHTAYRQRFILSRVRIVVWVAVAVGPVVVIRETGVEECSGAKAHCAIEEDRRDPGAGKSAACAIGCSRAAGICGRSAAGVSW